MIAVMICSGDTPSRRQLLRLELDLQLLLLDAGQRDRLYSVDRLQARHDARLQQGRELVAGSQRRGDGELDDRERC